MNIEQCDDPLLLRREVDSLAELNHELYSKIDQMNNEFRIKSESQEKIQSELQCERKALMASNEKLSEENRHLCQKIQTITLEMKSMEAENNELLENAKRQDEEMGTLESYKTLTQTLTKDNTDLLRELDNLQAIVQKKVASEESIAQERKCLLDRINNNDEIIAKFKSDAYEINEKNAELARRVEVLTEKNAALISSNDHAEAELKNLRCRVDSEVSDEVHQEYARISALENEKMEMNKKTASLEHKCESLKQENCGMATRLQEQVVIIESLTEKCDGAMIAKLEKAVKEKTAELSDSRATLKQKVNALLAAEDLCYR